MSAAASDSSKLTRCEAILLQIGLLLVILLLLPKSTPHTEKAHSITELHHEGASHAAASVRYAVVFDAGSTGSRVHIFKFEQAAQGGGLKLISDTFEQLKPGLSSFPDDPVAAAMSLKPLIDIALKTVPSELQVCPQPMLTCHRCRGCGVGCPENCGHGTSVVGQHTRATLGHIRARGLMANSQYPRTCQLFFCLQASTPASLKATAGLRLLPGNKADEILREVTAHLKELPFALAEGAVSILGGV